MKSKESEINRWRDTQRPARFFIFDPMISFFVGLFLLHIQIWTFLLLLFVAFGNIILERKGIRLTAIPRIIKTYFTGPVIPAYGFDQLRYAVDRPIVEYIILPREKSSILTNTQKTKPKMED